MLIRPDGVCKTEPFIEIPYSKLDDIVALRWSLEDIGTLQIF
jgi:hypothetical protein